TVTGLAADGLRYVGFLYAGLMIADDGTPSVLEYNCRLGDPETQPILMRLESDLLGLIDAAMAGRLGAAKAVWSEQTALGVVLAAGGYPGDYQKGVVVTGEPGSATPDVKAFHAGTELRGAEVVNTGGRVMCVTALGTDLAEARRRAYAALGDISMAGGFYRTDIGAAG
ncbi:phosphoribosylglycinamide synthetase C domain-containing protein, partial [Thiohalocapsa halophila]